ncbi:GDP-L-fucose synthase family protein [Desulfobulbus alkaliphilus]|uniref:GDP-L-fucose synthase family protein n=1 Tax=Desulfobulbus alkaliphilus TaxID=869814 RepID=UPI00196424F0|nr:GDP-L-fucose synthase [Desulfobulbus alkaliphilus]MBM9538363.1 GDP-L-fucose synthase [Desulfobulbus alkaliphilus]
MPSPDSSLLTSHSKIYIAGHRGMVGSAMVRKLLANGYKNIITRTHKELDLTEQQAVRDFFHKEKIEYVVLAAAKVGGIHANNTYPADFITTNLQIQTNVISEAFRAGIDKLLFLGSSCIYPKFAPQPMKEEYLLTGELEFTNQPYAIAKIAGIKMCEAYNRQYGTRYRSVMPTNLYGPGDTYHLENSHVIPAMLRKFHLAKLAMQGDLKSIQQDQATYGPIPLDIKQAICLKLDSSSFLDGYVPGGKQSLPPAPHPSPLTAPPRPRVVLWGTGQARREFLHVDDMAAACVFVMGLNQSVFFPHSFLNIGTGLDHTIAETAELIREIVGFNGEVVYDADKPDGTPRKLLDTTRLNVLGWAPQYTMQAGLRDTYNRYQVSIQKRDISF